MRKHTALRLAAASAAAALLIACGAGTDPSAPPTRTPDSTTTFTTTLESPPATPSAAAPSIRQAATITDGVWEVPGEVKPGTYRTTVPETSRNCYWERLRDFEDKIDSIIANDNVAPGTRSIVTIGKTDKGFHAEGCGTWTKIK